MAINPTHLLQTPTDLPPAQADKGAQACWGRCTSCHSHHGQGVPIADILLNVDAGGLVESEEAVSSGQVEVRIFSLRWDGNESMGQSDGGILC